MDACTLNLRFAVYLNIFAVGKRIEEGHSVNGTGDWDNGDLGSATDFLSFGFLSVTWG